MYRLSYKKANHNLTYYREECFSVLSGSTSMVRCRIQLLDSAASGTEITNLKLKKLHLLGLIHEAKAEIIFV